MNQQYRSVLIAIIATIIVLLALFILIDTSNKLSLINHQTRGSQVYQK